MTELTSGPAESGDEEASDLIRLWMKAEDVAMHFNDLILNFRLKAIGAVTLAAGLFGSILLTKENVLVPRRELYLLFAAAMVFLVLVWVGILIIDVGYYSRLLRGAVWEAVRLEKASRGTIQLSIMIDKAVAGRSPDDEHKRDDSVDLSRVAFYVLPLVAFVGAATLALCLALKR